MRGYYFLSVLAVRITGCSKSPEQEQVSVTGEESQSAEMMPAYPDIAGLAKLMNSGKSNSATIVADALARANQLARLNAFITLDAEGAASQAEKLDRMRAGGMSEMLAVVDFLIKKERGILKNS